jgi:S-formylglutathione hydrolase FrmB
MLAMESNVESAELGEKGKFSTVSSHSGLLSLEIAIITLANLPDMPDWVMEIIECLVIQMEAAFSNGASINLDIGSGSIDDIDLDVWAEWLNNDPLTYLTRNELTALQDIVVYVDCGKSDELGFKEHAERFHEKLQELDFRHGFDIYEYPWTPEEWLNNLLSGHLFLKERIPVMLLFHSFVF